MICVITISGVAEKVIATLISTVIIAVAKIVLRHKNNRPADD